MEINLAGNLYEQLSEVHAENALKLKQILDLEDVLYGTRIIDLEDGSACWCCLPAITEDESTHDESCTKARESTKHLWRKIDAEST